MPPKYERQGIGKALVEAAEERIRSLARDFLSQGHPHVGAKMEMGVVNLRRVLFPWYKSQGYIEVEEIHPNDPGFDVLISEEYKDKVFLILMRKNLMLT